MAIQNDKKFLTSILKSYEFYNQHGAQAMIIGEQMPKIFSFVTGDEEKMITDSELMAGEH